jgi:two-component system chemotaxis sensor kinase CheA
MRYQLMKDNMELFQAFVDKSMESLQKIEDNILTLANSDNLSKSLDDIFGKIHTIKGLASFFCLAEITRLGHQIESLLDEIRKDGSWVNGEVIQVLLAAKDVLKEMIFQIGEACKNIGPETVLEAEVSCTYDVDMLSRDIDRLIKEYTGVITTPVAEMSQPEELQGVDEEGSISTHVADQLASEIFSISLDGLAMGLVEDFLLEADEHSAIITDSLLLKLDVNPKDTEALGDLFRRVHSLKGNVGLLLSVPLDNILQDVFRDLVDVLQNMESLLASVRDLRMPISGEIINVCFETMDAFSHSVTMLHRDVIAPNDGTLKEVAAKMQTLRDSMAVDTPQVLTDTKDAVTLPVTRMPAKNTALVKSADSAVVSAGSSIRVSGDKIDRIINIIGELAIAKNVFGQIAYKLNMEHGLPNVAREVKDAGQFVNRISAELEDAIMAMRMTEVRIAFQKFPRIVRDIALQTGKNIALIMEGEDTELDKNIIEQIGDPLLHLVRNSCDHGVETVEERQAAGKDPQGHVWLRAYNRGKYVIIEVEDDGRGMNPEILKCKAIEKGFFTEQQVQIMSEEQAFQLIVLPGFSTAKNVTEISGRGVGMDVVNSNITDLQGTLKITSQLGTGSKITIQLPLTLMVSKGLVVEVQGQLLVIPIDNVLEMAKVSAKKLVKRREKRILYHRNEVLGVVSLAEILKMPKQELAEYTPIVVITDGQSKVAMIVDKLLNEQDILVKPLPEYLSAISGMGGATIMGDGKVALVLNPVELMQLAISN